MSFGKKGLAAGQVTPAQGGFGRATQTANPETPAEKLDTDTQVQAANADDVAAVREAFVASERARRAEETGTSVEPVEQDAMGGLRNSSRPTPQPAQRLGDNNLGGGPVGASGISAHHEEEIRAAARSMARNKPMRSSGSTGSGSGYLFGDPASRNLGLAYVLWFVLGQLSLHRFYCGQKDSAFMQLGLFFVSIVTLFIFPPIGLVGFVVWACWLFGDLFMMPGMLRKFQAEHDPHSVFS